MSATKEKLEVLKTAAEQANTALANGEISQQQYDALQREIIETENELKRLTTEANNSHTALEKMGVLGETLQSAGDKISGVGQKLLPVTAGVTALGTIAVKTGADFDAAMSKVAAVSGATGSEMDALREKAREMGSKTKFSASEAADAMNYMAMAGWKTNDMLSGIEGIMNLAAASGEDLASTSDIVTDALTAFGLSASDSGHFADILAAASSNANTNVSMMGETFKYAAPVLGSLGYSAEDSAIAIGLMANAGIKSSQAGTALRSAITNLAKPTDTVASAMEQYGISLTDSSGKMYSLRELMEQLRQKLGGLSEAEQAQAAASLFGKEAMSGMLAIINGSPADFEKLSNAIDTCSDTVDGYNGTTEKMAAVMQDNLAGQVTILKSQLEELAISFSDISDAHHSFCGFPHSGTGGQAESTGSADQRNHCENCTGGCCFGSDAGGAGKDHLQRGDGLFRSVQTARPFLCCAEWHRSHYRSVGCVTGSVACHYRSCCRFGSCLCASLENQ
ncbi:MAG: phage tail tape measure protein [Ruminococcus sp.]